MNLDVVFPKSTELKKYIKYFLFIKNDQINYNRKHVSYPNTNCCLGLLKGSKLITVSKNEYKITDSDGFYSYLTGIYEQPKTFHYIGKFDEICIDFEPLGIEALTGIKVSNLKFIDEVVENQFNSSWKEIYNFIYATDNISLRAELLEDFFLKKISLNHRDKFIPFNEIFVNKISYLQNEFNLSYRSIHRLYKDNLGLSPKQFMNILRFRSIIQNNKHKNGHMLDLNYGYYDQSHLIREFKTFTNLTPRQFTQRVSSIESAVWMEIQ
ncbi:helix-turn-helix domain-containing protein [Winogradskyella luteola]|uniref:AraC family transcriptional regulator n=1 Tax=Winogradskyella luteola TaxID=2828330 RepID=A0A9X1FCQ9_9FLAO|nr:helix-turn-helix domain-containing protein [Winogradskyella luteola]MBV7270688.1 AraC family transcriptional regulator [Winogradskyella luteola]